MALEQDILLAIAPQDSEILKLTNLDSFYPDYECNIKNFE